MKNKFVLLFITVILIRVLFIFSCTTPGSGGGGSSSGGGGGGESKAFQHTWTEYNTSGTKGVDFPDDRFRHAMAYIDNNIIVLFGGLNSSGDNSETWEYYTLTHTWIKINITGTPGVNFPESREKHKMAYICDSKIILFGGNNLPTTYSDTWVYDITTHSWSKMNIVGTEGVNFPNARHNHGMAYGGNNIAVLFGGYDNSMNLLNDTWEYNIEANTWTKIDFTGKTEGIDFPEARTSLALASADYLEDTKIVLFGGYSGSTYSDTWVYDITTHLWTKINITGIAGLDFPMGRYNHSLSYAGGDKITLFGGNDGSLNLLNDTWEYNITNNTWTKINITGIAGINYPDERNQLALAYGGNSNVILFGGNLGTSFSSETWVYR